MIKHDAAHRREAMKQALSGGGGMQAILNRAAQWLENPMVLIDTSYTLLAHTENPADDDPVWNELLAQGTFTHEMVDFFNRAQFISAVADTDDVALLHSDELKYDRICGKFFDTEGIQLGSVTVVACGRPFVPADYGDIAVLCECLSEENTRKPHPLMERVFQEGVFNDLLDSRRRPDDPALAVLDRGLQENLYVMVVDVSLYDPTLSHLSYLRDVFVRLQPECQGFLYLGSIILLLSSARGRLRVAEDLAPLAEFFEKYHIYAGLSHGFQNLLEIRTYYRQALAALNHGMSQPGGKNIFPRGTLALDFLLDLVNDAEAVRGLGDPAIRQCMEDDAANGTHDAALLHAYLLSAQRLEKTAMLLHQPPEEVQARLQDLTVRFGIDWEDGNQLASLLLSCKIWSR
ncbi:MAG: helix-turn-helix domain-containing protein [Oscillospiraceae bacterium]|jgi:hypothetical protein|nr:helix-turn-helix domain-containing protein [Oscillospiraceae bacterium]